MCLAHQEGTPGGILGCEHSATFACALVLPLKLMQYIFDLPKRLRHFVATQNYKSAVQSYLGSLPILEVRFQTPQVDQGHANGFGKELCFLPGAVRSF